MKNDKKNRPYSVVSYDPEWIRKYEEEKKILVEIFKERALNIEHIGSTSVPGLWAKPQIDIQVIVDNFGLVDNLIPQMESRGYIYQLLERARRWHEGRIKV